MKLRSFLLALIFAASAFAVAVACGTDKKGGIIVALQTDVRVPQDVNGLGIAVTADGALKYSNIFKVDVQDGFVHLPATISIEEADKGNPVVHVRAVAFRQGVARAVRDVITTVPHGRISSLRLPLSFLTVDDHVVGGEPVGSFNDAPLSVHTIHLNDNAPLATPDLFFDVSDTRCLITSDQTNVDGTCTDAHVDSGTLPDYVDTEFFGSTGPGTAQKCFDVDTCFHTAAVMPLDKTTCSFPLGTLDESTLNVALVGSAATGFCDQNGVCLVPLDSASEHGYQVDAADAGAARLVRLPPGACTSANVKEVVASQGQCPLKAVTTPIDGAGVVCLPDSATVDGGFNVTGANTEAGAGGDASVDAGPPPTVLVSDTTGITGLAIAGQQLFAASPSQLTWTTLAGVKQKTFPLTGTDAGPSPPSVVEVSADSQSVGVVFPYTRNAYLLQYDPAAPQNATFGFTQAMAPLPPLYGSFVVAGDVYFTSVSNAVGAAYVQPVNFTSPDNVYYCGMGGLNALDYDAFTISADGNTLYGLVDANSTLSLYSFSSSTLSPQCTTMPQANQLGSAIVTGVAMSAALVVDPKTEATRVAFLVTEGAKVVTIRAMDVSNFDVYTIASSTTIGVGATEPPHPLAADATGMLYYTDSAGSLYSVNGLANTVQTPKKYAFATDAFGVATDATHLYFTSKAQGVMRADLPLP